MIGPQVRDGTIRYDELHQAEQAAEHEKEMGKLGDLRAELEDLKREGQKQD